MTSGSLSIVVLAFDGVVHLPRLRSSLDPQLRPGDEVIVFDNASTDGTPAWVAEHWPEAKLVRSTKNLLFAAGNNAATAYASGEVVFYLNQDTEVAPGLLDRIREVTAPHRAVTVAQQFPWHGGALTPFLDWSGVLLWREPDGETEPTNIVSGGAFALHRETLARLGGVPFDARIPHYCEDVNLSLRLADLGVEMVAVARPHLLHHSTPSKGSPWADFRRAIEIQRNLLLAFAYARGWPHTLAHLPVLVASGWRKAGVDGQATMVRRLALTVATVAGFLRVIVDRPEPVTVESLDPPP